MAGRTPKLAMRLVGPKYGDDGIDFRCEHIKRAADVCGLKMKIIRHSTPGLVGFLGRMFPDATHSNNSYFDVPRALKKIPVVANGSCEPLVGLARKVAGFLAADPTTPVLSPYCRALQRIYGFDPGHQYKVTRSEERYLQMMQSPWPCAQGVGDCQSTDAAIAEQLGLTVGEMIQLNENLDKVNTEEGMRTLQFSTRMIAELDPPNVYFFDE